MNYSIRLTEKAEEKALSALVTEPQRATIDSAKKKDIPASTPVLKQPADEIPSSVLVPQTFRLPQRLIEDLVRAGESERYRGWIEKGTSGCRESQNYITVKLSSAMDAYQGFDVDDRSKFNVAMPPCFVIVSWRSCSGSEQRRFVIPIIESVPTPERITPYPTGRFFWGGAVPGTSCQATIARSLRDVSQQALASAPSH